MVDRVATAACVICLLSFVFSLFVSFARSNCCCTVCFQLSFSTCFDLVMSLPCPVCVRNVLNCEEGIQCDAPCSRWFHRVCLNMSKADYKKFADDSNLKWTCGRVDCVVSSSQPQNLLLSQLTLLTDKISELSVKVDSLTSLPAKVDNLITEVDNISRNLVALESRVGVNETSVKKLEEKLGALCASSGPSCYPEEIIAEMQDRSRRSRNVMLFNLAESQDGNVEARRQQDRSAINKLVTTYLPDIDFSAVKVLRVGKTQSNKTRPVKLIFGSDSDARGFMMSFTSASASQIDQRFSNTRVSRDRTPREMEHLNSLRTELSRRVSGGERGLTIKFVNNVPQIVKNSKNA